MSTNFTNDSGRSLDIGNPIIHSNAYRCHVALIREDEGDFSAVVLNLPGVGSCGATESEAMVNVGEAVSAAIVSYLSDQAKIPWLEPDSYTIPENVRLEWISVNA